MARDLLRVGRLPGSGQAWTSWRWAVVALPVAAAVVLAGRVASDPANLPGAAAALVLLGLLWWTLLSLDAWVDPERGRLRQTCTVLRWEVVLAEATTVRFQHNNAGLVSLQVKSRGRWRSVRVPVVGIDVRGPRAQPPLVLQVLAGEVREWAAAEHHAVADELDEQAAHLERGGPIHHSPLFLRHARRR